MARSDNGGSTPAPLGRSITSPTIQRSIYPRAIRIGCVVVGAVAALFGAGQTGEPQPTPRDASYDAREGLQLVLMGLSVVALGKTDSRHSDRSTSLARAVRVNVAHFTLMLLAVPLSGGE